MLEHIDDRAVIGGDLAVERTDDAVCHSIAQLAERVTDGVNGFTDQHGVAVTQFRCTESVCLDLQDCDIIVLFRADNS